MSDFNIPKGYVLIPKEMLDDLMVDASKWRSMSKLPEGVPIGGRKTEVSDDKIKESFRIKTECDNCGYQSMIIYPEDKRLCPTIHCDGSMLAFE